MIQFAKDLRRSFFPLILTHLAPQEFSQYQTKGLKQHFLEKRTSEIKDKDLRRLITRRNSLENTDPEYESISRFYLHYNSAETEQIPNCNFSTGFTGSAFFKASLESHWTNYTNGTNNFDPFSICTYVRIKLEENIHDKIATSLQMGFINTNKTVDKFNYAERNGILVPDTFYLLSLIYNNALHASENQFNFLEDKLNTQLANPILKAMLIEAMSSET